MGEPNRKQSSFKLNVKDNQVEWTCLGSLGSPRIPCSWVPPLFVVWASTRSFLWSRTTGAASDREAEVHGGYVIPRAPFSSGLPAVGNESLIHQPLVGQMLRDNLEFRLAGPVWSWRFACLLLAFTPPPLLILLLLHCFLLRALNTLLADESWSWALLVSST